MGAEELDLLEKFVIPLVVGLSTIIVAVSALWTSKQANKTSEMALQMASKFHQESHSIEVNRDKSEIYDLVFEWAEKRWNPKIIAGLETDSSLNAMISKAVLRLTQLKDENSMALALILNSYEKQRTELPPQIHSYICGVMKVRIEALILIWISFANSKDLLAKISEPSMESLVNDAKKSIHKEVFE